MHDLLIMFKIQHLVQCLFIESFFFQFWFGFGPWSLVKINVLKKYLLYFWLFLFSKTNFLVFNFCQSLRASLEYVRGQKQSAEINFKQRIYDHRKQLDLFSCASYNSWSKGYYTNLYSDDIHESSCLKCKITHDLRPASPQVLHFALTEAADRAITPCNGCRLCLLIMHQSHKALISSNLTNFSAQHMCLYYIYRGDEKPCCWLLLGSGERELLLPGCAKVSGGRSVV